MSIVPSPVTDGIRSLFWQTFLFCCHVISCLFTDISVSLWWESLGFELDIVSNCGTLSSTHRRQKTEERCFPPPPLSKLWCSLCWTQTRLPLTYEIERIGTCNASKLGCNTFKRVMGRSSPKFPPPPDSPLRLKNEIGINCTVQSFELSCRDAVVGLHNANHLHWMHFKNSVQFSNLKWVVSA